MPELILAGIAGGLWTLIVFGLGRAVGYRQRGQELPAPTASGECGCDHAQSFHYQGAGKCSHITYLGKWPYENRCSCQKYIAKTPLDPLGIYRELDGL